MTTRREAVRLELEDSFTSEMARAAAATALLKRELNDLPGSTRRASSGVDQTTGSVKRSGSEFDRSAKSIDKYSGRLGLLVDAATALGPALVPIGAVGVPAVAGLASQLGFATLAAGTLVGSMQGVGDAVKKLEAARVAPTDASIEAARVAMSKLSEDGQKFALTLQAFLPELRKIRDAGGEGWFPGLTKALVDLERLGPKAAEIFKEIGKAGGDLAAEGAASLTSDRWMPFFDFIEHEAPKAITDLAHTVGDLAHGLAELWMAFTPLNNDFSTWMADAADSFDKWASGLSQTQGFQEFVDYIRTNGPIVADALGSIANAVLQIVEAAAPLGGPTLKILTSVADAIASLADSDLGTPLIALASLASTMRLLGRATDGIAPKFTKAGASVRTFGADLQAASRFGYMTRTEMERSAVATGRLSTQFKSFGKNAALIGGIGLAASGASDKLGLTNTVTLALAGSMAGPLGAALGGAAGLAMDLGNRFDGITPAMTNYKDLIDQVSAATLEQARAGQVNTDQLIKQAQAGLAVARALGDGEEEKAAQAALDHARALDHVVTSEQNLASAQDGTRRLFEVQTDAINQNIEAINARRDALSGSLNAELGYKSSLLDARDALKKNGVTVNENTRAGQANLQALYSMASSYAQFATQTDQTEKQVESARRKFVAMAVAMGMGEDKARRLSKQLYDIPTDIPVNFHYTDDDLMGHVQALKRELASIDRDVFINIHARMPNLGGMGPQVGFSGGGYTGNRPGHEVVGVVHGHEFVMDAVATARIGVANLYALQRQYRGYASGGYVKPIRSAGAVMSSSRTERVETVRTIVVDAGALGQIVHDTASGVSRAVVSSDRAYRSATSPRPTRKGRE